LIISTNVNEAIETTTQIIEYIITFLAFFTFSSLHAENKNINHQIIVAIIARIATYFVTSLIITNKNLTGFSFLIIPHHS